MDLNFRGTKLSRIENFRVSIFADARPTILYYIYRLYICTNMCFAYKPYITSILKISIKNFKGFRNVRKSIETSDDISVATLTHRIL